MDNLFGGGTHILKIDSQGKWRISEGSEEERRMATNQLMARFLFILNAI